MTPGTVQTGRQAVEAAVSRFFHMLNTHCLANVSPLLTSDVELQADQAMKGLEAVNGYFKWLWDSYPSLAFRVESMIIDGTSVAAEVTYQDGPAKEGARCFVFQMRGELLRRIRCY
ncbi:MAG TPA: nuclear transport factor 2 family protein [Symbiobacteriaceae bacterium]|jgi:predicted ester cyclase